MCLLGPNLRRPACGGPLCFMIELRGITQTYQGSQGPVEALKGIDLVVQQGDTRMLTWMRPTSGGVNFEGNGVNFHEFKGGADWTQGDKQYPCQQQP